MASTETDRLKEILREKIIEFIEESVDEDSIKDLLLDGIDELMTESAFNVLEATIKTNQYLCNYFGLLLDSFEKN